MGRDGGEGNRTCCRETSYARLKVVTTDLLRYFIMSYRKAMKHAANGRKSRKQASMHFGFSTLDVNERRKIPIFGRAVYEQGEEYVKMRIAEYEAETARMLRENPNLVLV